mmetsp:Transcript_111930/g.311612  ORF Transcript_111930/g.311612 Transcript_111930/m.311612 type:complete len:215 (+) Transcript_111930:203-847(+)
MRSAGRTLPLSEAGSPTRWPSCNPRGRRTPRPRRQRPQGGRRRRLHRQLSCSSSRALRWVLGSYAPRGQNGSCGTQTYGGSARCTSTLQTRRSSLTARAVCGCTARRRAANGRSGTPTCRESGTSMCFRAARKSLVTAGAAFGCSARRSLDGNCGMRRIAPRRKNTGSPRIRSSWETAAEASGYCAPRRGRGSCGTSACGGDVRCTSTRQTRGS